MQQTSRIILSGVVILLLFPAEAFARVFVPKVSFSGSGGLNVAELSYFSTLGPELSFRPSVQLHGSHADGTNAASFEASGDLIKRFDDASNREGIWFSARLVSAYYREYQTSVVTDDDSRAFSSQRMALTYFGAGHWQRVKCGVINTGVLFGVVQGRGLMLPRLTFGLEY